jgi:putative tricarboxylic transport membrane protein
MGVALAIPFTFGMSAINGLTLLTGIYIGGVSGGFISATLLNMPGTPSSITTCFDAYPMSCQGKSGQALGLGLISSFIGGISAVFVLITLAPLIARQALKFGPFEYFSLGILAFVAISSMLGGNIWKNLISLAIGIILGTVGIDTINGLPRLTFGYYQLDGGISLLPFLVGLLCVSQIIEDIESKIDVIVPLQARNVSFKKLFPPLQIFTDNIKNYIRSFLVGLVIGIFPGIGGATSNIISYGLAKSSSRHPDRFGKGAPEGIIAAETANNASIGGAMIPLIALGIPGDAVTAILIGGFMIHGINPGPLLFRYNPDLVYAIFSAQVWGNVLMFVAGLSLIKFFIFTLSFPKKYLLTLVTVFCAIGAFAMSNRLFDVWILVFSGIFGYLWRKLDFPLVAIIIAFILEPIVEQNLRQGLTASMGSFLPIITSPISLGLLISAVFIFILSQYLSRALKSKVVKINSDADRP